MKFLINEFKAKLIVVSRNHNTFKLVFDIRTSTELNLVTHIAGI
jgi:hypothetical protein